MYKYIKSYKIGFNEGIKDAFRNGNKKFKKIEDKEIISKLYDIGYVSGYTKIRKYINNSFNYKKNSV